MARVATCTGNVVGCRRPRDDKSQAFQTRFTPPAICLALLEQHLIGHINATQVSQDLNSHRAATTLFDRHHDGQLCELKSISLSCLDIMS
jgi:hypothetical protein